MNIAHLQNKRALVIGLGATGSSVVRYLKRHNIHFDVVDERAEPSEELSQQLLGADFHQTLTAELCVNYDVLVLSPGVPRSHTAVQQALSQGVPVIGDIELFVGAIGDAPVVAVTGSNGKSTVVSWIAHVLKQCNKQVVLCGNIGLPALDAIDANAEVYVLELSSYQLESTESLQTVSSTVLNISDDHMDRYDSIDSYAAVKRKIYSGSQTVVFNQDDERTWLSDDLASSCGNVVAFSMHSGTSAVYQLQPAANDSSVKELWLSRGEDRLVNSALLPIPGDHNVANALAVIALLEPIALDDKKMVAALLEFNGLEHRTEFVRERHNVRWYNDSKGTNVDACENAILAMSAPVVLIAGGLGKGAEFSALKKTVAKHVKAAVLIGEDAPIIAEAFAGSTAIVMANTLTEAVEQSAALAESGDVVLLSPACSSFDMFDNFEQRGIAFKAAVEALAA